MHRKKVQSKKMCSLILAGVMVFGSSQTAAFAIQGDDASGVTGSDTDTLPVIQLRYRKIWRTEHIPEQRRWSMMKMKILTNIRSAWK